MPGGRLPLQALQAGDRPWDAAATSGRERPGRPADRRSQALESPEFLTGIGDARLAAEDAGGEGHDDPDQGRAGPKRSRSRGDAPLTEEGSRMVDTQVEARDITDPLGADGRTQKEPGACTSTF
jgi:hypothetical protein